MRQQLEDEGRVIIPDADMYTNNFRCMFVPKNLSPQEVEEGVWRCTNEFYSLKSMFKRLLMPPSKFTWQGLTENALFTGAPSGESIRSIITRPIADR